MTTVTAQALLHSGEVELEFLRSSGPGGQNVNKVETAVRLRYHLARSTMVPEEVRSRLARHAGRRITSDGDLLIEARRFRTQDANRQDALARLDALLAKAWHAPRVRHATRPSRAAKERRLSAKKRRGATKSLRGRGADAE